MVYIIIIYLLHPFKYIGESIYNILPTEVWYIVLLASLDDLSRGMRFPTMCYVWQGKAQTSLRICAVWSEPLLVPWLFYDC